MTSRVRTDLRTLARRFHRDERGQLLPLILFLAIAFYTSVAMVVNAGRSTHEKIGAQNAVDAAVVSGTNALARGMNYLASNNITQSKLLASVIIVRAFDGAVEDAFESLEDVKDAAQKMIDEGQAMLGTPAAPVGAVLRAAGRAIMAKIEAPIRGERALLTRLERILSEGGSARRYWDNEPHGFAWRAMKALQALGDDVAKLSPVIAQITARVIYERNMERFEGGEAWLLPLYPALPVCIGEFGEFAEPTRKTTQEGAEWVYDKARWDLVLSRFNAHYQRHVESEFNELFTGQGTISGPLDDPDLDLAKELTERTVDIGRQIIEEDRRQKQLRQQLAGLEARQAAGEEGLEGAISDTEEAIEESEEREQELIREGKETAKETQEAMERRLLGDRGRQPPEIGPLQGPTIDRDYPLPYLLDGSGYPETFTTFALGTRHPQPVMASARFDHPNYEGCVFAAARVFNGTRADLWTPDWRAKLVAADRSYFRQSSGREPGPCGSDGGTPGIGRVRRALGSIPNERGLAREMARMLNDLNHH